MTEILFESQTETPEKSLFFTKWPLQIALALGLLIRLLKLNVNGLEPDELHSLTLASQSTLTDLWSYLSSSRNPHPSAHYIFYWFWIRIAGTSEVALRLPSLIMGMITIWAIYRLSEGLFNHRIAGYAALWAAVISGMIVVSVQARMYSQLVLFSTLFIDQLSRHFNSREPVEKNGYISTIVTGLILAHTHHFGTMLVFSALAVLLIIHQSQKRELKPILIVSGITGIGYLPQIGHTITDLSGGDGGNYIEQYLDWDILLVILSRQLNGSMLIAMIAILSTIILLGWRVKSGSFDNQRGWYTIGTWWGGCFGISLIISLILTPVISPANMMVVLPATVVLAGAVTATILESLNQKQEMIATAFIFLLFSSHLFFAHDIINSTNPEIKEAFHAGSEAVGDENLVLVVYSSQLSWPATGGCYYCEQFEGEIEQTIIYRGDMNSTLNDISSTNSTTILFIHLTGWVNPLSSAEIATIEGLGEVTFRSSHHMVETAMIQRA